MIDVKGPSGISPLVLSDPRLSVRTAVHQIPANRTLRWTFYHGDDDYCDGDDDYGSAFDDDGDAPSPELRAAPTHRTGLAFHAAMLKHKVTLVFLIQYSIKILLQALPAQKPCISAQKLKRSKNVAVRLWEQWTTPRESWEAAVLACQASRRWTPPRLPPGLSSWCSPTWRSMTKLTRML